MSGIAGIKEWMQPSADLAYSAPLYDGLREASIGD